MAETEIRLEIVTPDSTVYSEVVDHVVVPRGAVAVELLQGPVLPIGFSPLFYPAVFVEDSLKTEH